MCVESLDPNSGKSRIASDRSVEVLEQQISNLKASEAVLQAQLKKMQDELNLALASGRDLQSQLDWERAKNHDEL